MARDAVPFVLRYFRGLFRVPPAFGQSDRQLLEDFAHRRDEAAFAALVQRHGPMVLAACRRLLGNDHDAEDAFQATFSTPRSSSTSG